MNTGCPREVLIKYIVPADQYLKDMPPTDSLILSKHPQAAKMESGAIDHVAIDVKDVEKVHELVTAAGLNTTNDEVHFLPFWENGVKFFTIEGPNKEKVEFSQYL